MAGGNTTRRRDTGDKAGGDEAGHGAARANGADDSGMARQNASAGERERARGSTGAAGAQGADDAGGEGMQATAASDSGGGSWRWASTLFKASSAAKRLLSGAADAMHGAWTGAMSAVGGKRTAAEMAEAADDRSRRVRPRVGDG